jgi:hypothetical protein
MGGFWSLRRADGSGPVAIITLHGNEAPFLNPRYEHIDVDYGPIPLLSDITPEQADQLWGSGPTESNPSNERTYRLMCRNFGWAFFLDLVFDHRKLVKYRVRVPSFPNSWREPAEGQ